MNDQQRNEIIKALAYGNAPEAIADAEDVELSEVKDIKARCGLEIEEVRAELQEGGFLNGN